MLYNILWEFFNVSWIVTFLNLATTKEEAGVDNYIHVLSGILERTFKIFSLHIKPLTVDLSCQNY